MSNDNTELTLTAGGGITDVNIAETAKSKFLDYSMSVITDRALPDVRDGLKPVHRRILFAMEELHINPASPHKKSARVVGDVIGKYHPHGDASVYEAMVRMAQTFSMRAPLVDGQGNFGSIDGDSPAAMRYTEARMSALGKALFDDIELDTVDFDPNYDGTAKEPSVLPCPFPNLLINGVQGIAVGMAASIPPHNPVEVMTALRYMAEQRAQGRECSLDILRTLIPAPDFPTGGQVYNLAGMASAWTDGTGNLSLRGRWQEETLSAGRSSIVITEIPYQVNKTRLIEKIVELAKPNKAKGGVTEVEGIFEVRDESDKDGLRIFIGVKKDFEPEVIFSKLAKLSQLEVSINYNATVLVNGCPQQIGLQAILDHFIDHRLAVITRRTQTLDRKAAERLHILYGLLKALEPANLNRVIETIRAADSPQEANEALQTLLAIDSTQAQSILDMRLQRLTGLQLDELRQETVKLEAARQGYAHILEAEQNRLAVLIQETEAQIERFSAMKNKKGNHPLRDRLTEVATHLSVFDLGALTKQEECTLYLTAQGYLRRMPVSTIGSQNRGTRGKRLMNLREGDFIVQSLNADSHDCLLAVTESGRVIGIRAFEVPENEAGRFVDNLMQTNGERVVRLLSTPSLSDDSVSLVMMTTGGYVKRTRLPEFTSATRKGGVIGINLEEGDRIVFVGLAGEQDELASLSSDGRIIRYEAAEAREVGRSARGVTGMRFNDGQHKVAGAVIHARDREGYLVCVTDHGMAKVSALSDYRPQARGGKGLIAMRLNTRTGKLFTALVADTLEGDLVVTTRAGITNRISLDTLNVSGRNTMGMKLVTLKEGDSVADVFATEKALGQDENLGG